MIMRWAEKMASEVNILRWEKLEKTGILRPIQKILGSP